MAGGRWLGCGLKEIKNSRARPGGDGRAVDSNRFLISLATLMIGLLVPALLLLVIWGNRNARRWFGAGLVYWLFLLCLYLVAVTQQAWLMVPAEALLGIYLSVLAGVLRRYLSQPKSRLVALGPMGVLVTLRVLTVLLDSSLLAATRFAVVIALDFWIASLCIRVGRRHASRSMTLIGLSLAGYAAVFSTRVVEIISSGKVLLWWHESPLYDASIVVHLVAMIFVNFGFAGFLLEKQEATLLGVRNENAALTASKERLNQAIRERDRMLLVNAQFSGIVGLSAFSSSLIHQLSQPLMLAKLKIWETLSSLDAAKKPSLGNLRTALRGLDGQIEAAQGLLNATRSIVAQGEVHRILTRLEDELAKVRPIIESEARASGIGLSITGAGGLLLADPALLQQVLIILVGRALAIQGRNPPDRRQLHLTLWQDGPVIGMDIDYHPEAPTPDRAAPDGAAPDPGDPAAGRADHLAVEMAGRIVALWQGRLDLTRAPESDLARMRLQFERHSL